MTRRVLHFLVAVAVALSCVTVTAQAADNKSGWIELLEYSSINAHGNQFTLVGTSGNVIINLEKAMRLRKIDMLIWHPTGQRFSSASVTSGTTTNKLDIIPIGSNLCRVVGYVPNSNYSRLAVNFKKATSTSQTYEILSWKVTPIGVQEFALDADVYIDGGYYGTSEHITIPGTTDEYAEPTAEIRISTSEWRAYDSISIWGSATDMMISSIRASIGTTGLDYSISYIDSESGGFYFDYDEYESGNYFGMDENDGIYSGEDWATGEGSAAPYGKTLFCITIDLAGADRATNDLLVVYLTGIIEPVWGYMFNCQYVNGSLVTADTTDVTWWNKITSFFSDLLDPSSDEAESFKDEAAQKGEEMDELNNQLQEATKPPISDIGMDIDGYIDNTSQANFGNALTRLTNNTLLISMMAMTLTIALVGYILFGKR